MRYNDNSDDESWWRMLELPGYRILDTIINHDEIQVYRVERLADRVRMIAKTTGGTSAAPGDASTAFQYEYEQLLRLQGRGALIPYSLGTAGGRPVLFMHDYNGLTLEQLLRTQRDSMRLSELLQVAIAAVECIHQLHEAGLILHKITPFYLLVRDDLQEVKLIDLNASQLAGQLLQPSAVRRTDDILPYVSPEQTGRTGIVPDARTDIYTIGIILYEWFARSRPFQSQQVIDMVYYHLATEAEPLHRANPSVPRMVSKIVHRCMAKMPEARYARAYGIRCDLEDCLVQVRISGKVHDFPLAQRDYKERRLLSSELLGRRQEQQALLQALQYVSTGAKTLIRVSGPAGVGKTALVNQTLGRAASSPRFYVRGSCPDVPSPYAVWVEVMERLLAFMLLEDRYQADVWKERLLTAIQGDGRLLLELLPRLALLIGEQPAMSESSMLEAEDRLPLMMKRYIQLFMKRDQPLVIFLDDMQRADESSLSVLQALMDDNDSAHLLIIAAYRQDELTDRHPLYPWIQRQEGNRQESEPIRLHPFALPVLQEEMARGLMRDELEVNELAQLLMNKTEGIPVYLHQFIASIMEQRCLYFNEGKQLWEWNMEQIAAVSVPESAAEQRVDAFRQMPAQLTRILGRAAMIGMQFELDMLAVLTKYPLERLRELASDAVRLRVLQPLPGAGDRYIFQHDHLHRSAIADVAETERGNLHAQIGLIRLQQMKAGKDVQAADVLIHWNEAHEQVIREGHLHELAALNVQAGLQAKQTQAYEPALCHMRTAVELLSASGWEQHRELTYQAYWEAAELTYLCAQYAASEAFYQQLFEHALDNMERVQIYIRMIRLEMSRDRYEAVAVLGEEALRLLGYRCNRSPNLAALGRQWFSVRRKMGKRPVPSFAKLAPMTDERHIAAMTVLTNMSDALYALDKNGWLYGIFLMIEMTIDHGLVPEASHAFASYALVLHYRFRDYETAYHWGKLACETAKPNPALFLRAYTTFAVCYNSWRKYEPGFLLAYERQAAEAAVQSGDQWQADYNAVMSCGLLFEFGHPLKDVYVRLLTQASAMVQDETSLHWKQAAIMAQLIYALTGYAAANDPYRDTDIAAPAFSAGVIGDHTQLIQDLVCMYQYVTGYMLGDLQTARQALNQSARIILSRQDQFIEPTSLYYYEVLVLKEEYERGNDKEQADILRKLHLYSRKLNKLARQVPENYMHKYCLAEAERARLRRNNRRAELYYERALDAARTNGLIHDVAIIAECYAHYGVRAGKLSLARMYMNEAYDAFVRWGAFAKTADMEKKSGHLLQIKRDTEFERLDYTSIVRSAQAISGEMEMSGLLRTVMRIMLQNAGAGYGALILGSEERWKVAAYGSTDELQVEPIPLEDAGHLIPITMINYTIRTKEELVIYDAGSHEPLVPLNYRNDKTHKSMLCLPIMQQNKLIGVLYMENNLTAGIFTKERLDVLKLLSAQCAISITNAELFTGLEQLKISLEDQVEQRTRELERSMQATSEALAETTLYAERNRIAKEIHDIVGHTLTSTVLQIEAGKRLLHKDMDSAVARLKEAQDLVRHSLNEIRNSVHMLKEDKYYPIVQAMNQLISDTERNTGVRIHAAVEPMLHLSLIQKKALYHALQEGLTNGIRHGRCTEFRFSLKREDGTVHFRLEDNGLGASNAKMGFGLSMMQDRILQLNGTLSFESEPHKGCILQIRLPYSE